jgi:hypothetical protein
MAATGMSLAAARQRATSTWTGLRVLDEIISLACEVQRVVAAVRPRNRELAD